MEIVLVRHAQPAWTVDRVAQVDPELTELGVEQAELTAQRLADERFDEVLVSTAARARATAQPIRPHHPDAIHEERAWLHEIHMPRSWQGTPGEEVDRALTEARGRPREEWWDGMPGGESFHDFHARVTIGLDAELGERGVEPVGDGLWRVPDEDLRLLMIAHGGTNSVILGRLLGLPPEPWEWERFAMSHASLIVIRSTVIASDNIFSLRSFSDVGHLPTRLHTN